MTFGLEWTDALRQDKTSITIEAEDGRYADWTIRFAHNPRQATVVSMTNNDMAALWRALSEHNERNDMPEQTTPRPIREIAAEIRADWTNINYAAVPYLDAMDALDTMDDFFYLDSAESIVSRFLVNAGTWRGETARRIKAELRQMEATR